MAMSYLVPPDCCNEDQKNEDYAIFTNGGDPADDVVVCAECSDTVCLTSQLPQSVLDQMEDMRQS